MKIEVHLYAMLRESIGSTCWLEFTQSSITCEEVVVAFKEKFPMFVHTPLRVAINHSFANSTDLIASDSIHIALIPPVSGG
jgi:molybdopterin converting factor small subunit